MSMTITQIASCKACSCLSLCLMQTAYKGDSDSIFMQRETLQENEMARSKLEYIHVWLDTVWVHTTICTLLKRSAILIHIESLGYFLVRSEGILLNLPWPVERAWHALLFALSMHLFVFALVQLLWQLPYAYLPQPLSKPQPAHPHL